jgi:trans-aconitate methyltransferase
MRTNSRRVVDLGCGPGHFASLFRNTPNIEYIGYDFSTVAISQAIERNKELQNCMFKVQDLKKEMPIHRNAIYTSFEFFEHVDFDLDILEKLSNGDVIIFSVPNYDSAGHVRFFKNEEEILARYSNYINTEVLGVSNFGEKGKHKIFLCKGVRI